MKNLGQSGQGPDPPAGDIVLNEHSSANRGQDNDVRRDLVILDVPWLINGVWVRRVKPLTGLIRDVQKISLNVCSDLTM